MDVKLLFAFLMLEITRASVGLSLFFVLKNVVSPVLIIISLECVLFGCSQWVSTVFTKRMTKKNI